MFFASQKRRRKHLRNFRSRRNCASKQYRSLESRQLLAFLPPPVMTTNVADFAHTIDDAIVRVDDQQRLVIRTTGQENRIDLRLDQGYLQVNRESVFSSALEIDLSQYQRIVMIGGGEDELRVWGTELTAQMHPDRLWVAGESRSFSSGLSGSLELHGNGFEHVEVNDSGQQDYGPLLHLSRNRIRMHGSAGVERLDMVSTNNFSVKTSVSMTGDDFYFSANTFGDLYVTGRGGNDFASLAGTRGFEAGAVLNDSSASSGNDIYTGRNNWSRIQNDLWDARFVDFETQRVNLLSGEDSAMIADTNRPAAWYRADGQDLVGAFRRLMNVEAIQVTGSDVTSEVLLEPVAENATLDVAADSYRWSGDFAAAADTPRYLAEAFPPTFEWTFDSFDRLA